MRMVCRRLISSLALMASFCVAARGQSLGDVAREQKQKQQSKKSQAVAKVITNEDLPESSTTTTSSNPHSEVPSSPLSSPSEGEHWKAEIAAQRNAVDNLQRQIDQLSSSIHFAPGNCVRNCVQYNEHQVQKQEEVQRMQADLEQQKKRLEDMQEAARKEGFGNSVYEP